LTTLSEANIILVLEHGELVQIGSHEELVSQEGLYKRVWMIQNSLEEELETELENNNVKIGIDKKKISLETAL